MDSLRASEMEKARDEMFKAAQREKDRIKEETASYRLNKTSDKFSSSSNAVEMALTQATVGLVSKDEFMRRKQAIEGGTGGVGGPGSSAGEGGEAAPAEGEKKKKKKKKEAKSILSFEAEDGEEGEEAEVVHKKPKKNPSVVSYEIRKDEPAPAPAPLEEAKPKEAPELKPMPPGYTCIKAGNGGVELALEVMATQSAPATKITNMCSHSIAMVVQATERNNEANDVLCNYLKAALGAEVTCEVTRGHRAPVKTVVVRNFSGLPDAGLVDATYTLLYATWKR